MSLLEVIRHALQVTVLVFLMMLVIDFIDVKTRGHFRELMKGGVWRQYVTASFLGATPGCVGALMNTSRYLLGSLSLARLSRV